MSEFHTNDLPPLFEDIPVLQPKNWKLEDKPVTTDEWEWVDDAYGSPCRGVLVGILLSSVFWVGIYIAILWFRGTF